jgi:BMFP domain-containing protein YqiC
MNHRPTSTPEQLVQQISELVREHLPDGLAEMGHDLRHNLKALVSESLSRMDLVSREEFDVQTKVLARTRSRLEALQQRVDELEKQLNSAP